MESSAHSSCPSLFHHLLHNYLPIIDLPLSLPIPLFIDSPFPLPTSPTTPNLYPITKVKATPFYFHFLYESYSTYLFSQ